MKSLPRGPAGPGEVWPGASTDAPSPRKSSNKLFQGFRRLGKAQASCFKVSEASERPKQVVSRFPTRRKGSNRLFQDFRGLGASGTPAKFAGYGLLRYPAKPLPRLGRMKRASSVRGCSDEASEGGSTTPEAAQISATPCRVGWRGGRASYWPDRHAGGRHRGIDRG